MDVSKYKILETDFNGKGVSAQSNPMQKSEDEAKAVFDQLVKEVVTPKFNALVEALKPLDLTSDLNKPVSTAVQVALNKKVDKELRTGSTSAYKVLSDNNYSDAEKQKVQNAANAQHSHGNKALLDKLTETDIDNWNGGNVLTKDNTTAYTPALPYHPATRKYVDDKIVKAGAGDMDSSVYDPQGRKTDIFALVSNPNLLDNWYFADPINQRGETTYPGGAYTIDRWVAGANLTITVTGDGVVVANTSSISGSGVGFYHLSDTSVFNGIKGKTVTLAVLEANGTLCSSTVTVPTDKPTSGSTRLASFNSSFGAIQLYLTYQGYVQVLIAATAAGSSGTVVAAKLELGSQQTLARQENGNWVLNDPPPNKQQELAKCQRYQFNPIPHNNAAFPIGYGYAASETSIRIMIPTPCTMRTTPSFEYLSGDISGLTLYGNNTTIIPISLAERSVSPNGIHAIFNVTGATANATYVLRTTGAVPLFNANL